MNGIWNKDDATHHQSSLKLAKWLADYLPKETPVVDFGCGTGYYMGYLETKGFSTLGIDGNTPEIPLCSNFIQKDLTAILSFADKFNVVSLEVGEHLPKKYQENFMRNITKFCDKHLILSWAEIGQAGIGHINCRTQEDVIADVESRGFKLNITATYEARCNVDRNCDWLERNILIFERA
jgi:cyclopropane fatty-acyl-phospholipid synthase-like methyltransferase